MNQPRTLVQTSQYITAVVYIANQCHQVSHDQSTFEHLCSSDRQIPADVLADLGILKRQEHYSGHYLWNVSSAEGFVECVRSNLAYGPSFDVVLCALTFSFFAPHEDHFGFLVDQGVYEPQMITRATIIRKTEQVPVLTASGKELEALSFEWPWAPSPST